MKTRMNLLAAAALLGAIAVAPSAQAFVVNIDNFEVFKNGISYVNDDFNVPGPLGDSGLFPDSSQATYILQNGGAQTEGVVPGRRTLNTDLAPTSLSPVTGGLIRSTGATLATNRDPLPDTRGLKSDDEIKVVGLFDLVTPPLVATGGSLYEIYLTDRFDAANPGDDTLRLQVLRSPITGNTLVRYADFDPAGAIQAILGSVVLTAADLAHEQIMLMLQNSPGDLAAFTASFAFVDGGVAGAEIAVPGVATAFNGEDWTRAAFRAIQSVPEPATLALLGLGVIGFGTLHRRR